MNIADVMQEIADQLDTITDLRVHAYPPDKVTPPAAIVTFPDITYDGTYGRGMDRFQLDVVVMVGKAYARVSRDLLGPYMDGTGDSSVKAVVEAGTYTEFDMVRVTEVRVDVVKVGGTDYVAATFTLDIAGTGAA